MTGGALSPRAGLGCVQQGRSRVWGCRGSLAQQQGRAPMFLSSGTSTVLGNGQGVVVPHSPALCPAVCNAGVGLMGPLETCSDQAMKTLFDVNLFGAVRTIQAFLPAMKRRRAGRIIVSSSIGGLQGGTWPCCSGTLGTLRHGEPRGRDPVLRVHLCPRAALQLCVLRQQVCGGGTVREPGHRPAALQHPVSTGSTEGGCAAVPQAPGWGMPGWGALCQLTRLAQAATPLPPAA